jgi:eukaryotic-like serine/threonine-protein kinase
MEKIGKYRITAQIGRGGFGRVYRAYDPTVGREVAIKVLTDAGEEQAAMVARFRVEASAAGGLQHKNIVTIFEYGEHEGVPYLVMEYLNGQDLHDVLKKGHSLTLLDKLSIMSQVAEGLNHAHVHGVVHRDVKPANIMVLKDGGVKIMDFGIARMVRDHGARLTQTGMLMGTVPYMAPEQFAGDRVDHITDIFAYGVIFYEVLTGTHPFRPPDAALSQVMFNIATLDPPPVSSIVSGCPIALDSILARILHKEREQRYHSLEDVLIDLAPNQMDLQAAFAEEHLQLASRLLDGGQVDEARSIIRDVLRRDPSNRAARQLRDSLQGHAKRQSRERSRSLAEAGRREIEAGNYPEAMRLLEEAHRLDTTNTDASVLLEQARDAIERHKRAANLLAQAKIKHAADDLTGAYQSAVEALSLTPDSEPASALLANIRREIEERNRRRRLKEDADRVRDLVGANSFDEALAILDQLQTAYPDSRTLRQLQHEVRAKLDQRRREQLQREVAQVRQAISEGRHGEAASMLERLARDHTQDTEVHALQAHVQKQIEEKKKADRINGALARAEKSTRALQFDQARDHVDSALKTDPSEPALRAMLDWIDAAERHQGVRSAIGQAEQLASRKEFPAALECLDRAIARWGEEGLASVRTRVDSERQRHERSVEVANAARGARQLLDRDNPQAAVDSLRAALASHPDEAELSSLLATAEASLAAKRKAEKIGAVTERAESLLKTNAFDRAIEEIEEGRRQFPEEPELDRLREKVRTAHLVACRAGVSSLLDGGRFQAAIEAVESALGLFPADAALQNMRAAAGAAKARQARDQSIAVSLKQASIFRESGRIDEAISILEKEEKDSGSSEEILSLLSLLRQERAEQQRRQAALARIVDRASTLAARHDYAGAIDVVQVGLQEFPGSADLKILLQETRLAQSGHEQNEAARRAGEVVKKAAAKGDWIGAERTLQLTLREFPENDQISRMLDDVRRARRQAEVDALKAEIEDLRAAGNIEDAARKVETAVGEYPEELSFAELAERIAQQRQRCKEVHRSLEEARVLLDRGDAEAAARDLERALSKYPDEPELATLLESANAAINARRRAGFVEDALRKARELMEDAQPEKAVALLEGALNRYRDAKEIAMLLEAARDQAAAEKREAEIGRALSNVQSLVAQSRFAEAISELQQALARFPGDPALESALRDTAGRKARFDRQASIAVSCSQAESALNQGKTAEAFSILAASLAAYPGEPALLELQRRAAKLQQDQEKARVRSRDLQTLKKLSKAAESAGTLQDLESVEQQMEALRACYPEDAEFRAAETSVKSAIQTRQSRLTPSVPKGRAAGHGERPQLGRRKYLISGVAAAAAVLLVALGIRLARTPSGTGLVVTTSPPGAAIRIGNESCSTPECRFDLGNGTYEVEAILEGYRPVKRSLVVPGAPNPVRIELEALPTRVVISTNLESGSVLLDGRAAGTLEQGKFLIESVASGTHLIEIKGAGKEAARVDFEVTPGRTPSLTRPSVSSEVQVLVIGQLGNKASLISDGRPKTVSTANRSLGKLGPAPTSVENLPESTVEVVLQEGNRSWTYALQPSAQPTVAIFVSANRDTGLLLVETGVAGADVLVDGRVAGQTGVSGRLEIPLRTGAYRVALAKVGYEAAPVARVGIERDSVRRVALPLTPKGAVLALVGTLPGTDLMIDGRLVQTVNGDTTLPVSPGQRSIELRKDGYRPARFSRQFDPGSTVTIGPPEVTLAEIPKTQPDPRAIELQRWEVAQGSSDIGVLEQFRRDFPTSPRAAEAGVRIEQLEWEAARSRNDIAALQAFLVKYPNSSHRAEAEQRSAGIAWEKLDRNNRDGLRAFAKQYPQYAQQALAEIARLEQEARLQADLAAIQQTLTRLTQAFGRKNFQEVAILWPDVPSSFRSNFQEAREISLRVRPTSQPRIDGDTASLTCEWVFEARFQDQRKAVPIAATINLVRRSSDWGIQSIQFR